MEGHRHNVFQDEVTGTPWVNSLFSQKCIEACNVPGETQMNLNGPHPHCARW